MNETFEKWYKRADKFGHELRLLVKNGIKYEIALTSSKTPKRKYFKTIKSKKFQIRDVLLYEFEIVDKEEIAEIIKKNSDEQASYDKAFDITTHQLYNLLLTTNQYKKLCKFIETQNIELNTRFYLQRKGSGLKTQFYFSKVKESDKKH